MHDDDLDDLDDLDEAQDDPSLWEEPDEPDDPLYDPDDPEESLDRFFSTAESKPGSGRPPSPLEIQGTRGGPPTFPPRHRQPARQTPPQRA